MMTPEHHLTFGPFRLEPPPGRLWRDEQAIPLRPRSLALLRYLARHPGRLVTKAEVLQHVWTGTHVTDSVLRASVREIRAALGDPATAPRYLVTVERQGYRFLGGGDGEGPPPRTAGPLVGRQEDLAALEGWYQQAAHGTRQLVFVSGEAGVGKTTVVQMFLTHLAAARTPWTAWGHCVEHVGEGEPYLPFLEALGRLGHEQAVLAVLRRYAPLWLAHLPGLGREAEGARLQSPLPGTTPARMLRELAEALEALTADRVLVLVLEDLQWSDRTTIEALAYLAQRRAPAQLLVLGTYRPVEVLLQAHPVRGLVQELCGRGQGVERRLEFLRAADVTAYVAGRLGGPVAAPLAAFVAARTDGNALFMVTIVEHLLQQGVVVRRAGQWTLGEEAGTSVSSLPEDMRQLILRRMEALAPAARQVLETASVVGDVFAVAAVAAGVSSSLEDVEAVCEGLAAQRHVLEDTGWTVWPDGTRSGTYRFHHALYRQVLYEGLGTMRGVQLHGRIGARLEGGYGAQAGEIATQLAVHFERGGEVQRAVPYWQQVGEQAARRNAPHETIAALTKALALLATLPDTAARRYHALTLRLALGEQQRATQGVGASDVGDTYLQAYALCQQVGETPQLVRVLLALSQFHMNHGEVALADALAQQLLALAHHQSDTSFLVEGHYVMGTMAYYRGDFLTARGHLEHSCRLADTVQTPAPLLRSGFVWGVTPRTFLARVLWALGYDDQARQRSHEALSLARQGDHLPTLAYVESSVALVCQCRRDVAATLAHADALLGLAAVHRWPLRTAQGRLWRGWALAMLGEAATGVADLRQALASPEVGPEALRSYWLAALAEGYGQVGQPEAGLTVLMDAFTLVAATEVRWWEAELYRLQGALLLQRPHPEVSQAEACFQQALDVARGQQAKALELRAAMSLSRLWQQQGQQAAAHALLAPLYGWFSEGFDTADLQEAQALLAALR